MLGNARSRQNRLHYRFRHQAGARWFAAANLFECGNIESEMAEPEYVRVVMKCEIPHGKKKAFDIKGKPVLISNWKEQYYACSNICSHAEEKLEGGKAVNGWISCPMHGAKFDLATGRALALPAIKPIPVYDVRVVDDWIEVRV